MSKIICDVCGTSYPDTSIQCPICGCVRPGDVRLIMDESFDSADNATNVANTAYTPVKGGRFSKSNVRRRNENKVVSGNSIAANKEKAEAKKPTPAPVKKAEKPAAEKKLDKVGKNKYVSASEKAEPVKEKAKPAQKKNTPDRKIDAGYTIAIIIFIISIVLCIAFLVIKFMPEEFWQKDNQPLDESTTQYADDTDIDQDPTTAKPTDPTTPTAKPTDPTTPTTAPTQPVTQPTTTPPDAPTTPTYLIYEVKDGDNLWSIAAKLLGNGSRWEEICEINDIDVNNPQILAGQKLKIPQ